MLCALAISIEPLVEISHSGSSIARSKDVDDRACLVEYRHWALRLLCCFDSDHESNWGGIASSANSVWWDVRVLLPSVPSRASSVSSAERSEVGAKDLRFNGGPRLQ